MPFCIALVGKGLNKCLCHGIALYATAVLFVHTALLLVCTAFLFMLWHYSSCHGITLHAMALLFAPQCCSSAMVLLFGLQHCFFQCSSYCGISFMPWHWQLHWHFSLSWHWQLHCTLLHGVFVVLWHWWLCFTSCCGVFLCALVKQHAVVFFFMPQHCSITCHTAALALHIMHGAICCMM